MKELLKLLGAHRNQKLSPDIDRADFEQAIQIYYETMEGFLEADEDESRADNLAKSIFEFTGLNEALIFIFDYYYAHSDSLEKLIGKGRLAKHPKSKKYEAIIKIKDIEIILEDRDTNYDWNGEEQGTFEDILIRLGAKEVLKLRLISDSEFYVFEGEYHLYLFKPNGWILEIIDLYRNFYKAVSQDEKSQKKSSIKNKYL